MKSTHEAIARNRGGRMSESRDVQLWKPMSCVSGQPEKGKSERAAKLWAALNTGWAGHS